MLKYLLPVGVIGVCVVGAADAEARSRCPVGQIYRPTQGSCMSKSAAIQLGVYHAWHGRQAAHRVVRADQEPRVRMARDDEAADATASIPAEKSQASETRAPAVDRAAEQPSSSGPKITMMKVRRVSSEGALADPQPVLDRMPESKASPYGGLITFTPSAAAVLATR